MIRRVLEVLIALVVGGSVVTGCSRDSGTSGGTQHGRYLFAVHCAGCHEQLHPELRKQPPKLAGMFSAKVLASGAPATDLQIRKTILEGKGTMPAFGQRLSADEVDDLLKYLHTME